MKLTWQHLVLVVILLASVLAARIFASDGDDQTMIMIVTTVLAAIFGPKLAADQAADKQSDQLDTIEQAATKAEQQTNGVMDKRIADGVAAALIKHGLIDPEADDAPAPPAPGRHTAGG